MSRLAATLRWESVRQYRNKFYWVSAFLVVVLGGLFTLVPQAVRNDEGLWLPVLVVTNLNITTFYFVAALVLLEKAEGTLQALRVTPLRETEYLASKVLSLTGLALFETVVLVVVLFGWDLAWGWLLGGTLALGALYTLAGLVFVAAYRGINEFLLPSVGVVMALMVPLVEHFGGVDIAWLIWHPVQPALVLIRAGAGRPVEAAWLMYGVAASAAWIGVGVRLAAEA